MKVIMIAGMHRSGTSLLASILHSGGLFLGHELMHGGFDNIKGHYEDLEILAFHEKDLKIKKMHPNGIRIKNNKSLCFEEETLKRIENLLTKRKNLNVWGWKEPRSTMYIHHWKKIVPSLKVIAIYRPANQVIESLIRRNYKAIFKNNKLKQVNKLLHVIVYPLYLLWEIYNYRNAWIAYNMNILQFKEKYPDDIYIISINQLTDNYKKVVTSINNKFDLDIYLNTNKIFEKSLLNKQPNKLVSYFINHKIKYLEEQLEHASD